MSNDSHDFISPECKHKHKLCEHVVSIEHPHPDVYNWAVTNMRRDFDENKLKLSFIQTLD